jgi:hypothetical protein
MKVFYILAVFSFVSLSLSAGLVSIDADAFADGADISNVSSYVALSAVYSAGGLDGKVYAHTDPLVSTGDKVFANNLSAQWLNKSSGGYALRVDFTTLTDYAAIDFIGDGGLDYGTMDAYNSAGKWIAGDMAFLNFGQTYTAQVLRTDADIAYIIAGGMGALDSTVHLDHLVFGIPEPATCSLLSFGFLLLKPGKKKRTHLAG